MDKKGNYALLSESALHKSQVTHLQELEFFCKQRTLQIVVDGATHSRKDGLEDNRGSTPFAS